MEDGYKTLLQTILDLTHHLVDLVFIEMLVQQTSGYSGYYENDNNKHRLTGR